MSFQKETKVYPYLMLGIVAYIIKIIVFVSVSIPASLLLLSSRFYEGVIINLNQYSIDYQVNKDLWGNYRNVMQYAKHYDGFRFASSKYNIDEQSEYYDLLVDDNKEVVNYLVQFGASEGPSSSATIGTSEYVIYYLPDFIELTFYTNDLLKIKKFNSQKDYVFKLHISSNGGSKINTFINNRIETIINN